MLIALAALAALQQDLPLSILSHVHNHKAALGFLDHGAHGNGNDQILTLLSKAAVAAAIAAVLGLENTVEAEFRQGICIGNGFKYDISALTAVTAIGPAGSDKFFSSEGGAAVAALSGRYRDFCFIDKHI